MKRLIYPLVFIIVVLLFFWKVFFHGLLPISADTIVGMYHPWRDFFVKEYPNGIPFKNFLITDSVRQQYPWRQLAVELLKNKKMPFWNPYSFAGTPLLANFQSASFYPLNILFFLPFDFAWSILVILQPILAGLFLYLYLCCFNLKKEACFLGAITFAFSGFFVAWLEWNTVLHSALWLPLILLSIEKVLNWFNNHKSAKRRTQIAELCRRKSRVPKSLDDSSFSRIRRTCSIKTSAQLKTKNLILWAIVFVFSLVSSFFAGHLQTFFYVFLILLIYVIVRILSFKKEKRKVFLFFVPMLRSRILGFAGIICFLFFTILSVVQWLPTLKFINLSARGVDQINWQKEGWFIPWQHLVQFLVPDFFGNPTTLNYWGVWNYGELVGYIGVLPLIMVFLAMIWRKDKKTLFFGTTFFLSLIFALPTWFAKLPFQLKMPFLSTSQPTRLLFLADFSLAILAALGFDLWLRKSLVVRTIRLLAIFALFYFGLWMFVLFGNRWLITEQWITNLSVAKRNLIFPTGIFIIITILLLTSRLISRKKQLSIINYQLSIIFFLLITVIFDLFRFGWKFTPFVKKEYLFPLTKTIEFLKKDKETFRFMSVDKRIFPPNFSIIYKLQTVDGYDPLYSLRYGELITASERGKPDISPPFGFNRMITPQNYQSRIIDLLNVKYVLSLRDENSSKLKKVFQEGETRVYENKNVFPRAFLVYDYKVAKDKQEAIEFLMDENVDLSKTAILEEELDLDNATMKPSKILVTLGPRGRQCNNEMIEGNKVEMLKYASNEIQLRVTTPCSALLLLSDNYDSSWKVFIDGKEDKIYQVDYNLRGVVITPGEHKIDFYASLL